MKANACEHGVPHPSYSFVTWTTSIEPLPPRHRIVQADSRDCPQCLRERIKNLRQSVELTLTAFSPSRRDEPLRRPQQKEYDQAIQLYFDDLKEGPL